MLLADDFIFHNEELAMKNFKKRAKEKLQSLQREFQRKKALIEEQEKAKMLKEKITELEQ